MKFGALFLTILAVSVAVGFSCVGASPPVQNGLLPTPTPYPVQDSDFTVSYVGGVEQIITHQHAGNDIFTLGDTTILSEYPRGMVFQVPVTSSAGEVTRVRLNVTYVSGESAFFRTTYDAELGVWIAHPWELGEGQPAWTPFTYEWEVLDDQDNIFTTEVQEIEYWDSTREWTRFEFETYIVYIYNYEAVYTPEELGEAFNTAISATEPRRAAMFGAQLSYRPVLVYYSDLEYGETIGSGLINETSSGFANGLWGMSVQFFETEFEEAPVTNDDSEPAAPTCLWWDKEFNPRQSPWDTGDSAQISLDFVIYYTAPHEMTHLYQGDLEVGGPNWWTEGQGQYAAYDTGITYMDSRLTYLANIDAQLPNIEDGVTRNQAMADGCIGLNYHLGHSFVNWLINNYGIETHAEIVRLQHEEKLDFFEAIETATDTSFLELQNQWRAYVGYTQLSLADVDPASALADALDPLYSEGDSFVLAGGIQIPMYSQPGPVSLTSGACFNNTTVTVLRVGNLDGINYYEIDCQGQIGWLAEDAIQ